MTIRQQIKDGIAELYDYILLLEDTVRMTAKERDYLDKRLVEYENMARDFVEYKAPDHVCRMHFEMMLKKCDETETK